MTTPRGGPSSPTNSGFPMPSPEKLATNANNCGFPMPPQDKLAPWFSKDAVDEKLIGHLTNRIHVWYIFLHLPDKFTECRQIYHIHAYTCVIWVMHCCVWWVSNNLES